MNDTVLLPNTTHQKPCCRFGSMRLGSHGFTLFELILVLLILALTAGILLPRIGAGWKQIDDRDFLQEFVGTLKRAKIRSMNAGDMVTFRISGADRLYGFELPLERAIPPNVDMYADGLEEDMDTGDKLILFYPDGSLLGNDIEFAFDKARSYRIFIQPLTGEIQLRRIEGR